MAHIEKQTTNYKRKISFSIEKHVFLHFIVNDGNFYFPHFALAPKPHFYLNASLFFILIVVPLQIIF